MSFAWQHIHLLLFSQDWPLWLFPLPFHSCLEASFLSEAQFVERPAAWKQHLKPLRRFFSSSWHSGCIVFLHKCAGWHPSNISSFNFCPFPSRYLTESLSPFFSGPWDTQYPVSSAKPQGCYSWASTRSSPTSRRWPQCWWTPASGRSCRGPCCQAGATGICSLAKTGLKKKTEFGMKKHV